MTDEEPEQGGRRHDMPPRGAGNVDHDHDDIRALLGSLRVDEPVPSDVVERLDTTLAGLRRGVPADTLEEPATGVVVPLRRRLAPRVLAAAAAVVVLGGAAVGIGEVLQDDGDETTSAVAGGAAEDAPEEDGSTALGDADREDASGDGPAVAGLPVLRPEHLAEDVARLLAGPELSGEVGEPSPGVTEGFTGQPDAQCPGPEAVRVLAGTLTLPVRYDGRPAALVLEPPAPTGPAERVAEVWNCAGTERLARAVVPAVP